MTILDSISANRRRTDPVKAEAGMKKRWSVPMILLIICGPINPMNPMRPTKETITAV